MFLSFVLRSPQPPRMRPPPAAADTATAPLIRERGDDQPACDADPGIGKAEKKGKESVPGPGLRRWIRTLRSVELDGETRSSKTPARKCPFQLRRERHSVNDDLPRSPLFSRVCRRMEQ